MASVGPNSPATEVEDTSSGTTAWGSYTKALVYDGDYDSLVSAGVSSYYIKVTGFSFSLPAGAVPSGVRVEISGMTNGGAGHLWSVRLVKGGTIQGDTKTAAIPTPLQAYASLGGDGDMWDLTLVDTDVEAAGFGCVVQATNVGTGWLYRCDHIRITAYYTIPATGVTGAIIC